MARIISELRNRFLSENMVGKFIYVNVGVYVLFAFIDVVATLFNIKSPAIYLKLWLELPSSLPQFILQPWSILTYMFLHGGLMHLLWNMIALYWFGKYSSRSSPHAILWVCTYWEASSADSSSCLPTTFSPSSPLRWHTQGLWEHRRQCLQW